MIIDREHAQRLADSADRVLAGVSRGFRRYVHTQAAKTEELREAAEQTRKLCDHALGSLQDLGEKIISTAAPRTKRR